MSELPFLGLKPGMFTGAFQCPGCGFATSDGSLYECPACQYVWRQRPQPVQQVGGPKPGEAVVLACLVCGESVTDGRKVVFAGGTDLAHDECLHPAPAAEKAELPEELAAYAQLVQAAPKPKRKRRRRRKKKPVVAAVEPTEAEVVEE